MAKNVKITEDGSTKIIENAARIRTSLEGGGTCDWIPKDDVPLQELTVTKDGVYRPEEGCYGFSKITANGVGNAIEGDLIEKTVTKNGTYNIADESGSPYGYSKIIVNVDTSEDDGGGSGSGGGSPVVGKDEDGNDTMAEADDDGNIVMTALPTEIKVIIPPIKLEYNRYEEIDYSGISVYAYISKAVHWLGTTTTAVTEGSSDNTVSISGSNVTASVGDGILYAPDRTGQNDVQFVWDGTKWVKPSNYSAEKALWKSKEYKTGKIPFEELIFPIKRANGNEGKDRTSYEVVDDDNNRYIFTNTITIGKIDAWGGYDSPNVTYPGPDYHMVDSIYTISTTTPYAFMVLIGVYAYDIRLRYDTMHFSIFLYCITETPSLIGISENVKRIKKHYHTNGVQYPDVHDRTNLTLIEEENRLYDTVYLDKAFRRDLSYILPVSVNHSVEDTRGDSVHMYGFPLSSSPSNDALSKLAKGEYTQRTMVSLPVQWKRPGDGKILETTFTAWMKDDGGNGSAPGPGPAPTPPPPR